MTRVLICGASIAGPALAYWLRRYGWTAVVVERAPGLREAGQNVDVRGAGREVARRMGIDDRIAAATTGEQGTHFIGRHGEVVAAFPAGRTDSGGATGEREILRGDLAALLVEASREGDRPVEYRYGDHVTGIEQDTDEVRVQLAGGTEEAFDVVVAADGIGSSTRSLIIGDEAQIRPLGLAITYGTIPRADHDTPHWRWYNATGGRALTLRPDTKGTTRATLSTMTSTTNPAGSDLHGRAEQLAWLRERFADAGWEAERILAGFADADDLYSESVGQVHAPRWSVGRVGLVGDAAYCASPVSGMGTSLALVGAYVLAGELAAHVHPRDGFAGYERIMRPYVDQAQQLPPGVPRIANPSTRLGIAVFTTALRLAAAAPRPALVERLFAPPAEAIDLPDYAHLER